MNLLFLLHQTLDSGANMPRALALGREMYRLGHQVILLCEPPVRQIPMPRTAFEVVQPPQFAQAGLQGRGLHPASLVWRSRWLRGREYDVVQSFGVRPSTVLPAWWMQARGTCWVADWSDSWGWGGIGGQRGLLGKLTAGALDALLERLSRTRADGVSVVSSYLADLGRRWGLPASRILQLGGGSDVELIQPVERERARKSLGIRSRGPVIVFSGRSRFDLKIVGQIFDRIRRHEKEACLFLLGGASPRKLGLLGAEAVIDWGFLPPARMGEVIGAGDVMLLPLPDVPFNRARFPNRLGDYMAAGRPIVTNPTGDLGRVVAESGAGLVVGETPERMAEAVLELWADPIVRGEMGRRGRNYAEDTLSWSRLAERVEGFYQKLLLRGESRGLRESDPPRRGEGGPRAEKGP